MILARRRFSANEHARICHWEDTLMLRLTMAAAAASIAIAGSAAAQGFTAEGFQYGPRTSLPEGETAEIWNPAMRKLMAGGPLIGGTVRASDPRTYCAMAGAGYDFIWTEKQHEAIDWENTARMWRTCPGPAAPGARVAFESEREIQIAADMGALVIVVPTIDTVEEAQRAIDWTYFPPMGRRSAGGGQGPGEMWNNVPGGYRQTWNDNVVLILMIETLEGVENAREIAKLPGVDAIFAASGDLGNFSGYAEGDPEYEALITEVLAAAQEAGIAACAPLRWAERPGFTCFQAGTEAANIRRGAGVEIANATAAFGATGAGSPSALLSGITAECGQIVYEADCHAAVERALAAVKDKPDADLEAIRTSLSEVIAANPTQADRIREIVTGSGVAIGDL
jgi:2-keto-3-deoxy-L-rhamnonate aldolase RhmA